MNQSPIRFCLNKMVSLIIVVVILSSFSSIHAQSVIKGKVIDKITKEPLEAALVTNTQTFNNTITDKEGNFTLKNIHSKDSVAVYFIGYQSQKIKVITDNVVIELEKGLIDLKTETCIGVLVKLFICRVQ